MDCSTRVAQFNLYIPSLFWDMIGLKSKDQMAPQYLLIWGEAGDFNLII